MGAMLKLSKTLALGLVQFLLLAALVHAAPLAQNGLVLVTRVGSAASGRNQFEIADSSNAGAANIWAKIKDDPQVKIATAYYQQAQEMRVERIRRELSEDGEFSAEDQAILDDLPGPFPVYIEVGEGTAGAYNDWKGQFTLDYGNGQSEEVYAPRIVFKANDPVVSNTEGLLEQTVVHEIAHGFHAMAVGQSQTPYTSWLSRSHAGNMTTDGTLALIEGYAEFVGAYLTSRKTIAEDPANAIPNNLYLYDSEGNVKPPEELWQTEGWAASVLYQMANSGDIDQGFEKINRTLAEENPTTFQELIQGFQARYPSDAATVQKTLSTLSRNQIPATFSGQSSPYIVDQTATDDYAGYWANQSQYAQTAAVEDTDNGVGKWAHLATMVGGGALGAVFGISFGPVGIVLAAAAGTGIGHLIAKFLFDQDQAAASWEYQGYAAAPLSSLPDLSVEGAAAPATSLSAEAARELLDRRYREYLDALADDQASVEVVEGRRSEYEKAREVYRGALQSR